MVILYVSYWAKSSPSFIDFFIQLHIYIGRKREYAPSSVHIYIGRKREYAPSSVHWGGLGAMAPNTNKLAWCSNFYSILIPGQGQTKY